MKFRKMMVAAVAVALIGMMSQSASAQALSNNLFSQYETPQGASTTTSGLYMAPHYVPTNVGSSYYTYQPLQPHEMLYTHSRKYYNAYAGPESFYSNQCDCRGGGSGFNITTVKWQNGCSHMGPLPMSLQPFARVNDRIAQRFYCKKTRKRGRAAGGCASGDCGSASSGATATLTDQNFNR